MQGTEKDYERLKLTDWQKQLVKKAEDALRELQDSGVDIVYDNDSNEFYAVNANGIEDSRWELSYNIKEDEKDKATILDPFEFRNYGHRTKFDYHIIIPRWDDELIVYKFTE